MFIESTASRTSTPKIDPHLLRYLQKRDAMVARAVAFRLKKGSKNTPVDKQETVFYTLSVLSRPIHEPYKQFLEPTHTSATAILVSKISYSTLVREPAPMLSAILKPDGQVQAKKVLVEKLVSPPATRTRSKTKKPLPTPLAPTPTITHGPTKAVSKLETGPKPNTPSKLKMKQCPLHTCSKLHMCPRAPPWPPQCSLCGRLCHQTALVCSDCGSVLCNDHPGSLLFCHPPKS